MLAKTRKAFIFLLLQLTFIPGRSVLADTGPKPSMSFEFQQEYPGAAITIVSGKLYECEQPDCSDARPLEKLGPQHFDCQTDRCSALAYGFSQYHQLEIRFSDGVTRRSNIFETAQFQSNYQVTVRQIDLLVEPKFNLNLFTPLTYILLCGGCLIGIAILIVVIILLVRRSAKKK